MNNPYQSSPPSPKAPQPDLRGAMASQSWQGDPSRVSVVRAHSYFGIMYSIGAVLMALSSLANYAKGGADLGLAIAMFAMAALLAVSHFKTSSAVGAKKGWGRGASVLLSIVALLFFPIGTILGVYMLVNVPKMKSGGSQ